MSAYAKKSYGASNYARFRPTYPASLFNHLSKYVGVEKPTHTVDLGCGTGQATRDLAKLSKNVIGIDNSAVMIGQAEQHDNTPANIKYLVGNDKTIVEQLGSKSTDLLVVAEAAHWLTYPDFWKAAHTVLKPNGILAIWSYYLFSPVKYPIVGEIVRDLCNSQDKLGSWWDPGQWRLQDMYETLQPPKDLFKDEERQVNPFTHLTPGAPFELTAEMSLADMFDLLHTWSSYASWKNAHPDDPDILDLTQTRILEATGLKGDEKLEVKWETVYIFVRAI